MGLSGRKAKQRIPQDPRNLSWASDASRFGSTYLAKLGFDHSDKNATLGISGAGLSQHLKVHHKLDLLGIGAQHTVDPNGIAWKQNRDFENLLRRLNGNSEGTTEDGVNTTSIDGFHPAHTHESTADTADVGPETMGGDEDGRVEDGKRSKKKKRPRDVGEAAKVEGSKSKKRKQVESTTTVPDNQHTEGEPSTSNPHTQESILTLGKPHRHGRAHRARFIASKRLATTSTTAVAEILGISSSATSLSGSGLATPETPPLTETGEHGYLTVSTKSVAEYFKEKMGLVIPKSEGFGTVTNEAHNGGIGSRPRVGSCDEVERDGVLCVGLGRELLAKMSAAEVITEIPRQEETPGGGDKGMNERGYWTEDKGGEMSRRPKKKGKKSAQVVGR